MHWNIAKAKQKLSTVVREAANEPQLIYNRSALVAAVVSAELFQEFARWRRQRDQRTLGASFAQLRELCEQEGYSIDPDPRADRASSFLEMLDNGPY